METTIQMLAEKIKLERKLKDNKITSQIESERKIKLDNLLQEFEIGFADYLSMLKEAGVSWSAHFNTAWEHQGSYIKFKKEEKELKMDFSTRDSYRYEYVGVLGRERMGKMVYGNWSKEDFVLFINDNLLSK